MDPKSGIFTAIVPGCYLFCLTLCSQDMKKVLVALRKNGEEVTTLLKKEKLNHPLVQAGTIYDQNHNDNHRNSMASQSLLLELEQGDRVQVCFLTPSRS